MVEILSDYLYYKNWRGEKMKVRRLRGDILEHFKERQSGGERDTEMVISFLQDNKRKTALLRGERFIVSDRNTPDVKKTTSSIAYTDWLDQPKIAQWDDRIGVFVIDDG